MKRILITLVIALTAAGSATILPSLGPVASAQTKVALLTQPEGNVLLKRGKDSRRVTEDTLLNVGDVVSVNGNGTAVIYQAYVPVTRLGANEQFKVVRRSPPPPARALRSEEFTWFKVHYYTTARRNRRNPSPATMGGADDARLTLLEPRNSVALELRPTFNWSRVPGATRYMLNVYDGKEAVVCTETTAETKLKLPDKCKPLDPGEYKWEVTAQTGDRVSDDPALYDATSFAVATRARAAAISKAIGHAHEVAAGGRGEEASVYASALMEARLYPQAAAELRRALEQSPKDQTLWALLIETYAQMKLWRSREKAREISAGNPTAEMVKTLAAAR
jgi:hypothetical protein